MDHPKDQPLCLVLDCQGVYCAKHLEIYTILSPLVLDFAFKMLGKKKTYSPHGGEKG